MTGVLALKCGEFGRKFSRQTCSFVVISHRDTVPARVIDPLRHYIFLRKSQIIRFMIPVFSCIKKKVTYIPAPSDVAYLSRHQELGRSPPPLLPLTAQEAFGKEYEI
jgi:hypothetical protein